MTDSKSEANTEEAAATEENSSDRSSHGSSGGAGGGYSADYSGSASDEDEGPSSGSGSDDNNNNNNNKQSNSSTGSGGLRTLPNMANALPATNVESCAKDKNQGTEEDGPDASERSPSPLHLLRRRKRSADGTSYHKKPAPRSQVDSEETESSPMDAAPPKFHARSARHKTNTSSASSSSSSSSGSLDGEPLVRRPMDPRIDLSVVHTADSLKGIIHEANRGDLCDSNNFPSHMVAGHMMTSTNDSYQRLMEAVRPFFHSLGVPMSAMQQELHRSASEALSEGFTSFFTTTDSTVNKSAKEEEEDDESMAVLARTKRKHRRSAAEDTSGSNNETGESSTTSGEKRVRIQETQQQQQQQQQQKNSALGVKQQFQHPEAMKHSPRMVTDVSGSSTGQNNSSAGSGGNSNVGTSSSGNDGGGKSGSSEELGAKEEDGFNDNSEATASHNEKPKATTGITTCSNPQQAAAALEAHNHPCGNQLLPHNGAERERKLQDKKRKRIEMRREYEAQQDFDSSEASAAAQEQFFRPGKPIMLDNVLVLSEIPRIIIQGIPPFLVVHTNAAYCRLTGIDSHAIVGKPIKELLSIDKNNKITRPSDEQPPEGGGDDSISAQQRNQTSKPSEDITLEQLIATSGFGHTHNVQAHRKLLHQMVGKNVTVINNNNGSDPPAGAPKRDGEESNNASLTSSSDDGQERQPFPCRISIAPIVSPVTAINNSALVVDREAEVPFQKAKRTKHCHGATEQREQQDTKQRGGNSHPAVVSANHHRKAFQPLQMVTHFVIQLQPQGSDANEGSMESISSNSASVEARLLGLSQEQVKRQRDAVHVSAPHPEAEEEAVEEESTSETTSTKEPVATIG